MTLFEKKSNCCIKIGFFCISSLASVNSEGVFRNFYTDKLMC